ncbi:MAG: hypothetical protein RIC83_04365, partial [Alphaproteobacteria bacterium]
MSETTTARVAKATDDLSSDRAVDDAVAALGGGKDYRYGFTTDIESDMAPKGLSEDIVRFISAKKEEPEWLLAWRLKAFRLWQQIAPEEQEWARISH